MTMRVHEWRIVILGSAITITAAVGCGVSAPGEGTPYGPDIAAEIAQVQAARVARSEADLVELEIELRRHARLQERDGQPVWVLPAAEVVASFTTRDGRSATFEWQRLTDEVAYIERIKDGQAPLFGDDVSLLERYLQLAAEGAPVPRSLAFADEVAVEKPDLLAGRTLVESVPPVLLADEDVPGPPVTFAVTASCGGSGASWFADNHCYYLNSDLIAPNRHDALWCCDENFQSSGDAAEHSGTYSGCLDNSASGNSVWFTLNRTTTSTRWNSYSRTAACGNDASVWHDYLTPLGDWGNNHAADLDEDDVLAVFFKGAAKRHRRVHHQRNGDGGGVRAYSEFSNNF
jgi:hypothetical protein